VRVLTLFILCCFLLLLFVVVIILSSIVLLAQNGQFFNCVTAQFSRHKSPSNWVKHVTNSATRCLSAAVRGCTEVYWAVREADWRETSVTAVLVTAVLTFHSRRLSSMEAILRIFEL
jgi:hypothetical protein